MKISTVTGLLVLGPFVLGLLALGPVACGGAPGEVTATAAPASDSPSPAGAESPAGDALALWNDLLAEHEVAGGLHYADLAGDRRLLDEYLAAVAGADLSAWSREEKLAFWINAYNALVARGVLDRYPGLQSVIEVEGFFDAERHTVAGEELTLNELERKALDLDEPRVHFAVVCASTGCPDLLGEAFTARALESQLSAQTAAFLADTAKGLRLDEGAGTLWLSSIFDWYARDFGEDAVGWILPLLPRDLAAKIRSTGPEVEFIDYDWSPNDRS